MIKRKAFKYSLIASIIMTVFSICIQIALVIYQSTVSFSGLSNPGPANPICTNIYLAMKSTNFNVNLVISFLFLCTSLLFTILTFIFFLLGFIKFRETIMLNVDEDERVYQRKNKTIVFGKKGIILLYLLCSIVMLCNIVYFGLMLSYTIQFSVCTNYHSQLLILTILSGISFLLMFICWIILFVTNGKLNSIIQMEIASGKIQKLYTIGQFTEMNILQNQNQRNSPRKQPKDHYVNKLYKKNSNRNFDNIQRQFATNNQMGNKYSQHSKNQQQIKVDQTPKFTQDKKGEKKTKLLTGSYIKYMQQQSPSNERQDANDHPYFKSMKKKKYNQEQEEEYSNIRKDKQPVWSNKKILQKQIRNYLKSNPNNTILKSDNVSERSYEDEQGIFSKRKKKDSKMLIDRIRNKYAQ